MRRVISLGLSIQPEKITTQRKNGETLEHIIYRERNTNK